MSGPANSELETVNTCSTAKLKTLIQQELKGALLQKHLQELSAKEIQNYKSNLDTAIQTRINSPSLENMHENNKLPTLQQFKNSRDQDPVQWLELFNTLSTLAKWTPEEKAQQFPFYLAREASSWYSTAEVDKTKWYLISTAFTKWYKSNDSLKYVWLDEFWSIKHSEGQSVEEFIQKVLSVGAKLKQSNNDLMLAITKGLAPSVKGYVLLKDPKTLDELIEYARTVQHVQPQQSNNTDVAKMVSAIISEHLSELKTSINAIQFNSSRHQSQSPRQVRFQSQAEIQVLREAVVRHPSSTLVDTVVNLTLSFNAQHLIRLVTSVKRLVIFKVCVTGLRGVQALLQGQTISK